MCRSDWALLSLFALLAGGCAPRESDSSTPTADELAADTGYPLSYPLGNQENWLEPRYITASLRSVDQLFPTRTVERAARRIEPGVGYVRSERLPDAIRANVCPMRFGIDAAYRFEYPIAIGIVG